MSVCPIWKAIIQNVSYKPHPWDNAREGTLVGVDKAVVAIRAQVQAATDEAAHWHEAALKAANRVGWMEAELKNARKDAQADLLEALQGLLPDFTGGLDPFEPRAVVKARAAIAKARGQ